MSFSIKIRPASIATFKKLKNKNLNRFAETATKLASSAAKKSLERNTPKRFTGKLRSSYAIRKTKSGHKVVILGKRNQQAFASLNSGRKTVTPKKKSKLYIPVSKKGYNAAVRKSYSKSLKYGTDFVYAQKSKSVKGKKISGKAIKAGKERFKKRINLMAKQIFL
jgi:hypothetical protein